MHLLRTSQSSSESATATTGEPSKLHIRKEISVSHPKASCEDNILSRTSLCSAIFHSEASSSRNPKSSEYSLIHLPPLNRRVRKSKRNLWEQIRRALGKKMFLGNQSSLFSHIQIPIAAYYPFYMRLNWIPYRGRDFASCGAFFAKHSEEGVAEPLRRGVFVKRWRMW